MSLTTAEQLLYTTVKIHAFQGGQGIGTGTGFFYRAVRAQNKWLLLLITNKHVIEGCDTIRIFCHIGVGPDEPSGRFAQFDLTLDAVHMHPAEDVDLCAIPVNVIGVLANQQGHTLFMRGADIGIIPTGAEWDDFDAIEEVIMVGYPRGLHDEVNNMPLVRRGITATSVGKRYNGKAEFLVDLACFPGSSGSPVFLYNPNGFFDKRRNVNVLGSSRIKLLGILYAGPVFNNKGKIVFGLPSVMVGTMMHLGNVIRASEILPLAEIAMAEADKFLGSAAGL